MHVTPELMPKMHVTSGGDPVSHGHFTTSPKKLMLKPEHSSLQERLSIPDICKQGRQRETLTGPQRHRGWNSTRPEATAAGQVKSDRRRCQALPPQHPVATLWHLIPSAFRLLELVGIHGLVTHIVEDNSGTSEYSRDWSGEGIATEMSTRDFMGNMIGAIEQFRAALEPIQEAVYVNMVMPTFLYLYPRLLYTNLLNCLGQKISQICFCLEDAAFRKTSSRDIRNSTSCE
ncbi:hypothetical protein Anapl_16735 [Anas platyrhynchos]|uniref:Uncharacterized protein n=1 Tax=Anas platyrhynchos TaxID=8839 RepID=R0LZ53_ANAPL|nr:hypothetical protein Anapl_16735 [Anas platyrhynchos]